MRLAAIARADARGLAIQSTEFVRHMKPDRVLLVDMGEYSPYPTRRDQFVGARVAEFTKVTQDDIDYLLDGIDVLWTAETPYDYRILEQARERGVKTCVQANHEFMLWIGEHDRPRPDLFISPSTWHYEEWPTPKLYLPFPVARDKLPRRPISEARTFLHVAGHTAAKDRNGTMLVVMALRAIHSKIRLIVRSQSRIPSFAGRSPSNVKLELEKGKVLPNYWDLYAEGDVLVLPRRYGGQCLPFLEAMSVGMPVISLDVEPQNRFLPREGLIKPANRQHIPSQAGPIAWWDIRARDLAAKIDIFASDDEMVARLSNESELIAELFSWDQWGIDAYTRALETLAFEGPEAAARLRLWCPAGDPHCECRFGEKCQHEIVE